MMCPICFVGVHEGWSRYSISSATSEGHIYRFEKMRCPECHNDLIRYKSNEGNTIDDAIYETEFLIPLVKKPKNLSELIPDKYVKLYTESFTVLPHSPRASAALSRRCLQELLREYGNVTKGKLFNEIKQFTEKNDTPAEIAELLDVIRTFGNNAAHPNRYDTTGEIIDVEEDESKWGLEILEVLFDYFIINPHLRQEKLKKFHKKLAK